MDAILAALEATPLAAALRTSRWGYAAVSGAHILGIALLVGTIVALNLRMLGAWGQVPIAALTRVLVPVAAAGLSLAVLTGGLLFSVRAREYAEVGVLQAKLLLVALGAAAALELHRRYGMSLEGASRTRLATHAVLSMTCWLGALLCGRLIAFVAD